MIGPTFPKGGSVDATVRIWEDEVGVLQRTYMGPLSFSSDDSWAHGWRSTDHMKCRCSLLLTVERLCGWTDRGEPLPILSVLFNIALRVKGIKRVLDCEG